MFCRGNGPRHDGFCLNRGRGAVQTVENSALVSGLIAAVWPSQQLFSHQLSSTLDCDVTTQSRVYMNAPNNAIDVFLYSSNSFFSGRIKHNVKSVIFLLFSRTHHSLEG